jgi:hypothetical protein
MTTFASLLVAVALSIVGASGRADEAALRRQIVALGSDQYAEREAATQALIAAGGPAVPLVAKVVSESDREASTRAMFVLRRVAAAGDAGARKSARRALSALAKSGDPKIARIANEALREALVSAVTKLTEAGAHLSWDENRQVRRVNFSSARVEDAHVTALDDIEPVEIDFRNAHITDATLARLAEQLQLELLNLMSTRVTDAGMKHLAGLKNLRSLSVERTSVTDEGLAELAGLKELKVLYLGGSKIAGPGLKHVEDLPIEYLSFAFSPIGDEAVEHAVRIKSLKTLGLDDTKITDACLPGVAKLEKLEVLWLDNTGVSDACLAALKQMTWLKTLHAENTKISNKGFIELRAALKQTNIFGNGPIDAGREGAAPPADTPTSPREKDGRP